MVQQRAQVVDGGLELLHGDEVHGEVQLRQELAGAALGGLVERARARVGSARKGGGAGRAPRKKKGKTHERPSIRVTLLSARFK